MIRSKRVRKMKDISQSKSIDATGNISRILQLAHVNDSVDSESNVQFEPEITPEYVSQKLVTLHSSPDRNILTD